MVGTSELSVWDPSFNSGVIWSCGLYSVEFSLQRSVEVSTVKPSISLKCWEEYDHNILLNVSEIHTQKWVDFYRSSCYKNIALWNNFWGFGISETYFFGYLFKYFKKFKNKNLLRNIYQHPCLFKWKDRVIIRNIIIITLRIRFVICGITCPYAILQASLVTER